MKEWTDDEYCLHVNAREGSYLWMLLSDRSQSEDEEIWKSHIPAFRDLISQWVQLGFVKLCQGADWPVDLSTSEVPPDEVDGVLADPTSWQYEENPSRYTAVTVGDRDITELDEGM
ncbi:hypothetical protein [Streptomyces sp. NPDC056452]|uniref:hypothetical protein n=1 Tax=Streptomyces sp. NPDC056452 TaxID=3345821 RepID=UPI0036B9770F